MIKAVLFDYGGVLSEGGRAGSIRKIFAQAYGVDPESVRYEADGLQAVKGQMSDDAFLAAMNRRHADKPPVDRERFINSLDDLPPSGPVHELAKKLRTKDIKTGVLSNTLCLAADQLRARGAYDGFDPVLLSCETNLAKPETAFYQLALERLGCQPAEVLFIDDQPAFLEPARVLGMRTILAVSPEQIVRDTTALLTAENGLSL